MYLTDAMFKSGFIKHLFEALIGCRNKFKGTKKNYDPLKPVFWTFQICKLFWDYAFFLVVWILFAIPYESQFWILDLILRFYDLSSKKYFSDIDETRVRDIVRNYLSFATSLIPLVWDIFE